ncbi:MAG: hypothetical protein AAGA77_23145 [Bacteroidota bacterium]
MITYLVQSSICLILFYLVYHFLFRNHTLYIFNRCYLIGSILLSSIIPQLTLYTSTKTVSLTISNTIEVVKQVDQNSTFTLENALLCLYMGGVIISLSVLVRKLFNLVFLIRNGKIAYIKNQKVITVKDDIATCSFFNNIIISASKLNEVNEIEIEHEKVHISQYHSIDLVLSWIFQSIFWFNPVSYLYRQRLVEIHEFLADAFVITTVGKLDYQNFILTHVSQKLHSQLVHNFNSIIKMRLMMMNSTSKPNYLSYLAISIVLSFTLFQFSCKTKIASESRMPNSQIVPSYAIPTNLDDPRKRWLTEVVMDTTVTFDPESQKEVISVKRIELQYAIDTILTFDADTFEETISFVKTYKGASPGYFGI